MKSVQTRNKGRTGSYKGGIFFVFFIKVKIVERKLIADVFPRYSKFVFRNHFPRLDSNHKSHVLEAYALPLDQMRKALKDVAIS